MKIQRNRIAIGMADCFIFFVPLCATVARQFRIRQFKSIEAQITQYGCSLSWELIDGNYSVQLHGHAGSNETVKAISAILRDLAVASGGLGAGHPRSPSENDWAQNQTASPKGFQKCLFLKLSLEPI